MPLSANVAQGGTGMNIGNLGSDDIVFKRKFRWTMTVQPKCPNIPAIPAHYVKTSGRPSYDLDEVQIDFLNGRSWVPGKITPQTFDVTYYDVARDPSATGLYQWIAANFQFNNPLLLQGSNRSDYTAIVDLKLYDGCGQEIEEWVISDCWIKAVKFDDLDYASSDILTVTLTLRWSLLQFFPLCPSYSFGNCCTPCQ